MGSLEGRFGRRLARLEKLDKKARLKYLGQRWLEGITTLSDRQLLFEVLGDKRFTGEGRQDQLRDGVATLEELQGEERAAWAAYLASGAHAADIEIGDLLKEFPESEQEQLLKNVMDDPRVRNRLPSLAKIRNDMRKEADG